MAATGTLVTGAQLEAALGNPTEPAAGTFDQIAAAATAALLPYLKDGEYTDHPAVSEAALTVAVQLWQARTAPGGTMVAMDFGTVSLPHLLGPGLLKRVTGVLLPWLKYGGTAFA